MNATKILWTQVLVVCSVALAFVWGATQWTAAALGYQSRLGRPWFHLDGWPVYHPPAFFWWWFAYAEALKARVLQNRATRSLARQVSLDPADDMRM